MEEADSKQSDASRKCIRRRTHTRKAPLSCFINMAEARREIVNALQLHRSSSASDSKSTSCGVKINNPAILSSCNQKYCHRLINSMPIPEPTWSTTAPSVLCTPVPPAHEVMEFEWFDNISSSYSWWVGFLNSLDNKNCIDGLMENSEGLEEYCLDGENVEKSASDVNDQSPFTDEWLIFPASEEHEEQV